MYVLWLKKVLIFILGSIFFASFFATVYSLAMHENMSAEIMANIPTILWKGTEFTSSSESVAIMAAFLPVTIKNEGTFI